MDYVYWPILTVVGSFVGAFVSPYLTTKGKNLATHEDINGLVDQVKAVTMATKEIEAKVSSEVWDQQKRWETRKEILFDAVRHVARAQAILTDTVVSIGKIDAAKTRDDKAVALSRATECIGQCKDMAATMNVELTLVGLVSGKAVVSAFAQVTHIYWASMGLSTTESVAAAENKLMELGEAVVHLHSSIRAELKMPFD